MNFEAIRNVKKRLPKHSFSFLGCDGRKLITLSTRRNLLIGAFCSFAVLFTRSADADIAFEVSGTCKSTSWKENGEQLKSFSFPFRVRVRGVAWSIHVENLNASHIRKGGINSRELVYDGFDLFSVSHVPDPQTNGEAFGLPKSFKVPRYDTVALAGSHAFPVFGNTVDKVLWLAFCTSEYPALTVTNLPFITDQIQLTNCSSVAADYFQTIPHLLKSLKISAIGSVERGALVRLPAPLTDGYVALTLEVSSATNVSSDLVIPERITASFFEPVISTGVPRVYEVTRIEISAVVTGTDPEVMRPPELPGVAHILDTRFRSTNGLPFQYQETNAEWVARTAPDPIKTLQGKRKVPVSNVPNGDAHSMRARNMPVLLLFLVVLLSPLLVFARVTFRKFRSKDKPTKNV